MNKNKRKVEGGGLTLGLDKGDFITIGKDIKITLQRNSSKNCVQLRVLAPKEMEIMTERYEREKDKYAESI